MIVTRKLSADGQRIETVTLAAVTPADHEFLAALYRDCVKGEAVEVGLPDGQWLKSTLTERRRSPRIHAPIPVQLLWEEDQQTHQEHTFTTTLSWFGCAVHSHKFFRPGSRVQVKYGSKTMDARVARSLWDHSTNLVEVGLAFDQDGRGFWGITVWDE